MMKTGRNHKLFSRLIRHVGEFWQRSLGFPESCVVALSGGKDSMLLLEVVSALGVKHGFNVRAFHVDHGTQSQQAMIESHLQIECDRLGVELVIVRTELDALAANFEATARAHRLKLLHQGLQNNEVIVFGHHIDDSYEWSMLQSLRASSLIPTLGIPLVNGRRVRPFMCLTRKQISSLHRRLGLWHFEDSSNSQERFSRNHIRRVLKQEFAPRYPNYLRHYVARSNELAERLGVSVFTKSKLEIVRSDGVIAVFTTSPKGHEDELTQLVCELSSKSRGALRAEIGKLSDAFHRGRQGPHCLSGGISAWIFSGAMVFTSDLGAKRLKSKWDIASQIPSRYLSHESNTLLTAIWDAPAWIKKLAIKSHPLVVLPQGVVLLPRSRLVKIPSHRLVNQRIKHLNI